MVGDQGAGVPSDDCKFGGKDIDKVDYREWKGKNCFPCSGMFVTGPLRQIGGSLVMHTLLMITVVGWTFHALPYLATTS